MCGLLLLLDCFGSEPMFSFAQSRLLVSVILSSSSSASVSSSCASAYVCVCGVFSAFSVAFCCFNTSPAFQLRLIPRSSFAYIERFAKILPGISVG